LMDKHPVVVTISQHRGLNTLSSKYTKPLLLYTKRDKTTLSKGLGARIHPNILQCATPTGRLAMDEPNLQSIPHPKSIKLSESDTVEISVRRAFAARPGCVLLSADYSQLEARLMAHFSGDAALIAAFSGGADVFKAIGSTWLKKPAEEVTAEERQRAKGLCYGILYGAGPACLAAQMNVLEADAKRFMTQFLAQYPAVRDFLSSCVERCRKHGYVETVAGRRRYFPLMATGDARQKSAAERQAVNTVMQGSAADLIKLGCAPAQSSTHAQ
jgi:DNA polymerase I-like protein with 3'-5' exonuclease and polymerase domains